MSDDQHRFLALMGRFPARPTAEQAGLVLNCAVHDVPILVSSKLLKPLGNSAPNSIKYFATAEILELTKDRAWLAKLTNAIALHWKRKYLPKKRGPSIWVPEIQYLNLRY
jgi:hypothetical protein